MIWPRIADLSNRSQKISIHVPHILLLKDSIEQTQHLSPQQLVVSIHNDDDILLGAKISGGVSDVGDRVRTVCMDDDLPTTGIHLCLQFEHVLEHDPRAVS